MMWYQNTLLSVVTQHSFLLDKKRVSARHGNDCVFCVFCIFIVKLIFILLLFLYATIQSELQNKMNKCIKQTNSQRHANRRASVFNKKPKNELFVTHRLSVCSQLLQIFDWICYGWIDFYCTLSIDSDTYDDIWSCLNWAIFWKIISFLSLGSNAIEKRA